MQTLTTRKGRSIETPYTRDEVKAKLLDYIEPEGLLAHSDFAKRLVTTGKAHGLSPDQWTWVHILVVEAESKPQGPRAATVPSSGTFVPWIVEAFKKLRAANRKSLRVSLPGLGLKTGRSGRFAGQVHVTDGREYGENEWYGAIDPVTGFWRPRSNTPAALIQRVLNLDQTLEVEARQIGHESGSCCFCSLILTDPRSLTAGYGPICAGHYGLPWGDVAEHQVFAPPADADEGDFEVTR